MEGAPIPAATVVVMRDRVNAPPELLIVERSRAMVFAGGALVFPGGRIDPADVALGGDEEAAARIAAIRECIEEAGFAPGIMPPPDRATIAAIRGGTGVADLPLDLDALIPFARWLPLGMRHRIFDTRFYLARWIDGAPEPQVDATENTRLFWATAADVLALADAGRATLIFPTRRNLERLALFGSFDEAVAHARAHRQETITPWSEMRDGIEHLCIPEGLGYPVTAEPLTLVLRA